MGSTYSQHLSNDIGLFLLSGVVVVMLGNIWVNNMRDVFDTWKCHSDPNYRQHPTLKDAHLTESTSTASCKDPAAVAQFILLSVGVSLLLYFMIVAYARFLNNKYEVAPAATAPPKLQLFTGPSS